MTLEDGRRMRFRAVLGTDGIKSRVAASLGMSTPNYAGYAAYRSACCLLSTVQHPSYHALSSCPNLGKACSRNGNALARISFQLLDLAVIHHRLSL